MNMFFVMSFTLLLAVEFVTTAALAGPNTAVSSNNETNTAVVSNNANNPDTNNSDGPITDTDNSEDASMVHMNISVPSEEDDGTDNLLRDNQNGDVSNVITKGDVNVDRNLKQDQLSQLFLRTKMSNLHSIRGQLYCNTNSATIADCTIYVRAGEGTISINQNTVMERVLIICMGTQNNCMQVANGVSLHIHTAVISGNKKGRFIDMGRDSELILRDVEGYEFGTTGLYGGFIHSYHSTGKYKIEIANSTIRNNQGYHGGALFLYYAGELTIYNTVFEANSALYDGGAIRGHGVSSDSSRAKWNIQKTTFKKNTANRGGGGTYADYTTGTVSNTQFNENTAKTYGGGMFIRNRSIFTLQCSSFTSNKVSTTAYGGAVYSETTGTQIKLTKTMFLDNKDKNNAINDIYCSHSTVQITRDLYSTGLKNLATCKYQSIPPSSKDNVDCTPSA